MLNNLCTESNIMTNLGDTMKSAEEVELKDIGPDGSLEGSSKKTDATIKDSCKDSSAVTHLSNSQRSAEVSLTKQIGDNVVELIDTAPVFSLESPSMKTNATINESCKESPAVTDLSSSQRSAEVSLTKHRDNVVELIDTGPDFSLEGSSLNTDAIIKDSCKDSPAMTDLSSSPRNEGVSRAKRKGDSAIAVMDTGPSFSLEGSLMETDATIKESCKDSATMTDLSSSQRSAEISLTMYKRRKCCSPRHNAIVSNVNDIVVLKDTFSTETSVPALHKIPLHPVQYLSMNAVTRTSHAGGNFCPDEIERKEESMLEKAAETSKDDSNKISDETLTVGLVDKETKVLRDQVTSNWGSASGEMMLMTKNTCEQRFVTELSVADIPEVQLEEEIDGKVDGNQISIQDMSSAGYIADLSLVCKKDDHSMISRFPPDRIITNHSKKKLLVLDVNGLLADFVDHVPRGYEPDTWISRKSVFRRPFCDDFLKFCFDKFHVGVWSSRHKNNVDAAIEFLMGKSASKLLFCWNQSHCTMTNFSTVENKDKPLVLKELRKLWEKLEPGLPWEKAEFNESNTLLLDDSPHKALLNPMNTAIFPYSYDYRHTRDSSLGPGGDLRVYLEGLAVAEDVQAYVASNPFGQRPIRESNPSWRYYRRVINSVNASNNFRTSSHWERTA